LTLSSAGSPPLWDTEAVRGRHAGHSGLLYRCSPSTFCDLVAGTERWTDRTFLVQGGRRVSFDDFRCAIAAAGERLREWGIGRGDWVMSFGCHSPEWVVATAGPTPGRSWRSSSARSGAPRRHPVAD
jgi:hypothetical protein